MQSLKSISYVVFFGRKRVLGRAIVRAHNATQACLACHRLGINPGGSAAAYGLPPQVRMKDVQPYLNRRITTRDMRKIFRNVIAADKAAAA